MSWPPSTSRKDRATRPVLEAFSGAGVATIPVGTAEDLQTAVDRARVVQEGWAQLLPAKRAKVLDAFAELVHKHAGELMDMAQAETGKARSYAQGRSPRRRADRPLLRPQRPQDARRAQGQGHAARRHQRPRAVPAQGRRRRHQPVELPAHPRRVRRRRRPHGRQRRGVQPDSQTPYCALALAELLYQAGLPRELYAVVPGPGGVVGQAIMATTDYVMFTGSSETGASLAEQAGRRLISFSAIGGKNPLILTASANLGEAVPGVARACYSNSGQLCISIERIYVDKKIADEFTTRFAEYVKNMTLAGTYDFNADMGSLASAAQGQGRRGARAGRRRQGRDDRGRRQAARRPRTVLLRADRPDRRHRGSHLLRGRDLRAGRVDLPRRLHHRRAIKRANDTEYGLNASVFAGSSSGANAIADQLRADTVNINEGYAAAWASTAAPMGGMGISGVGRRHGTEGAAQVLRVADRRMVVILLAVAYLTFIERKVIGFMQGRLGPNRVGPGGWLQPIADVLKLPARGLPPLADKPLYYLGPMMVLVPAFAVWAVIPFGKDLVRPRRSSGTSSTRPISRISTGVPLSALTTSCSMSLLPRR